MLRKLKALLRPLLNTPFHPQWLTTVTGKKLRDWLAGSVRGPVVVDIGCGSSWPALVLPTSCRYIGLDYPETAAWYGTKPDVFGDAEALPFRDQSVDTILLLDVLEHLPAPRRCLAETHRCLKPQGIVILSVPFLYPIHDAPHDYRRWTLHGLKRMAAKEGFAVNREESTGSPLECAGLITNIALVKTVANWTAKRRIACVFWLVLPILVPAVNLLARLFARISPPDDMMPIGYQLLLRKIERN